MARTKIAFELELMVDEPTMLGAALRSIASQLASDPNVKAGEMIAEDGSLRWKTKSWSATDLVRCASCGREVPREQCDITPEGERCRNCSLASEADHHFEEALTNAYERGRILHPGKMSDFFVPWLK